MLVGVLVVQLALPLAPGMGTAAHAQARAETVSVDTATAHRDPAWRAAMDAAFSDDPVMAWLRSMPESEKNRPLFTGTLDRELVDEDPFYLRSQEWVTERTTARDIPVPGLRDKTLRLTAPLTPLLVGDAYVVPTGEKDTPLANAGGSFHLHP